MNHTEGCMGVSGSPERVLGLYVVIRGLPQIRGSFFRGPYNKGLSILENLCLKKYFGACIG